MVENVTINTDLDVDKIFKERFAASMGLDKYQTIMEQVRKTDVSKDFDFQKLFNGFYLIRRNESWRKVYYEYFESVKGDEATFESILEYLYETTGNIEPSFSSKMLATIFPDKPIWDKYVLQNLRLELVGKTKKERLVNAIKLYACIERWYKDFLQTEKAKECIDVFNQNFPNYIHISNVKKIDCILWSVR